MQRTPDSSGNLLTAALASRVLLGSLPPRSARGTARAIARRRSIAVSRPITRCRSVPVALPVALPVTRRRSIAISRTVSRRCAVTVPWTVAVTRIAITPAVTVAVTTATEVHAEVTGAVTVERSPVAAPQPGPPQPGPPHAWALWSGIAMAPAIVAAAKTLFSFLMRYLLLVD